MKLMDSVAAAIPTSFEELFDAYEKLQASGIFPTTQMTVNNAWTSMLWYSYAVGAYATGTKKYRFVI